MRCLPFRPACLLAVALAPTGALAEAFQRPIPQPRTPEAEVAYLAASLLLLLALIGVQWLVNRR